LSLLSCPDHFAPVLPVFWCVFILSLPCFLTQIAGASEFSLDVATTVLRCYQLQPTSANKELIAKTLLRALMQLPRPDYKICIHLLPERLVVSVFQSGGTLSYVLQYVLQWVG
jgi:hypothetical protein